MTDESNVSDLVTAELKTDGPTLAEYVAAGYKAENYPPQGYAVREETPEAEATPEVPAEPVEPPTHGVARDFSMGPSSGAEIKAFLEAKQAEADAKALAEG